MPENSSSEFWSYKLAAWLHDPPHKAFNIQEHEEWAAYRKALHLEKEFEEIDKSPDWQAAAMDRVPLPKGSRADWREGPSQRLITSAFGKKLEPLQMELDQAKQDLEWWDKQIATAGWHAKDRQAAFFYHWRLTPQKLAGQNPAWQYLPSDTRIPDHSIWDHLDLCSALEGARRDPASGQLGTQPAFLSISLGPVQDFIAAGRKLRDLWAGSFLVSYLSYTAAEAIADFLGPDVFIYPQLRGLALYDKHLLSKFLQNKLEGLAEPPADKLFVPCMPNKMLALVPQAAGQKAAELAQAAAKKAWSSVADSVRDYLLAKVKGEAEKIFQLWDEQVQSSLEFVWSLLPLPQNQGEPGFQQALDWVRKAGQSEAAFDNLKNIKECGLKWDYGQNYQVWEAYQPLYHLAEFYASAHKQVRLAGFYQGDSRSKSSLDGLREAMGPQTRDAARDWWKNLSDSVGEANLRPGERLDAIGLVKRFCLEAHFSKLDGFKGYNFPFDSVSDLAVKSFKEALKEKARENQDLAARVPKDFDEKNGELILGDEACKGKPQFKVYQDFVGSAKKAGIRPPDKYYALLMLDGDKMGPWMAGEKAPQLEQVLHPSLLKMLERESGAKQYLSSKRPINPAWHRAVSRELTNFSVEQVPKLVDKYLGQLVYSGGDDVLALVPLVCALPLAWALRQAFSQALGPQATASVGLVIAHYHEPLSVVLEEARRVEKLAKNEGRDRLGVSLLKRSGESPQVVLPFSIHGLFGQQGLLARSIAAFETHQLSPSLVPKLREWYAKRADQGPLLEGLDLKEGAQALWTFSFGRQAEKTFKEGANKLAEDWWRVEDLDRVEVLSLCNFIARGGR